CPLVRLVLDLFPTRRSSDLLASLERGGDAPGKGVVDERPVVRAFGKFARALDDVLQTVETLFGEGHVGLPGGDLSVTFDADGERSEEHTSELQSRFDLVCRL